MAEFLSYEQMAKNVTEKALDEYLIDGKTLREWIKIIAEQEPKTDGDCISRKDAIEQFIHWWSELLENEKEDETFDNILKALPTVTPQELKPKWIPVSERLPKSDGYYIVTENSGRVCTYVFHKEGNSEEYWKRCAIAWMPLPKSYEP